MNWKVDFESAFESEFDELSKSVQDELMAHSLLLEQFGPHLGRPSVDTLKGSVHANMKELRFDAEEGVWRVAFAFDPNRKAILLAVGDKRGVGEKRFYKHLVNRADVRFSAHLNILRTEKSSKREIRHKGKRR